MTTTGTKGRKAGAPAEQKGPDFVGKTPAVMAEPEARMNQIAESYSADRDLVNQLLGQAQAAGALEQFSRTVRISKLAFVKENKLYRELAGMKLRTGAEKLAGTWEEFCGLLGTSVDQIDRDIANLKAFGEEALESMSRMGIGYREMRQFRRLPEDERLALIETAKTGDKDALLDIAETLIAKHQKEKEDLTKKVDDLTADSEAKDHLIADKNIKIDSLAKKGRRKAADLWPEEVAGLKDDLHGLGKILDEALGKHLTLIDATEIEADKHAEDEKSPVLAGYKTVIHQLGEQIERICTLAAGLRNEYDTRLAGFIAMDKSFVLPE
ncbi:MAG: hypothetical protein Q7U97_17650 [Rhodocyclaceae bacterium]|nr:hypothetical protein [Rhodocyclaceae bacterium]